MFSQYVISMSFKHIISKGIADFFIDVNTGYVLYALFAFNRFPYLL